MSRRTVQTLNVVTRFVAIAGILAAVAALAQQTDRGQHRSASDGGFSPFAAITTLPTKNALFPAGSQSASFLPATISPVGCQPFSVAVADVNGDGHADLIVADWYQGCSGVSGPGEVDVLLGNGDGTFKEPVSYSSGGTQALAVAVGDLNGDGKMDIAVANSCQTGGEPCDGQIGVLLGNGNGTFQPVVSYYSGDALPSSVVIADVNGDGRPDLIAGNGCSGASGGGCTSPGSAGILLGNGDGTFQPGVSYDAGEESNIVSTAVADLNGDGHPDVIVVGSSGGNEAIVSVFLGNGDGTFQPAVTYDGGGIEPNSLAVSDLNSDGHPDVVVANYCLSIPKCNNGIDGVVSVLLGKGDGTFAPPVSYNSGGYDATSVAVKDVNGDGNPDLIVATSDPNGPNSTGPGQVGVLLGKGDGTFTSAENFPSGGGAPISLSMADVNGDGKSDIVVVNICQDGNCNGRILGSVGVLLNNSGVPQIPTTTALACSPASSGYGQTVTCNVTVHSTSGTAPGTAILYDGAVPVGSATLSKRKAVISVGSLTVGTHAVMAVYQGSSGFAPSTSPSVAETVVSSASTVVISSSANPAPIGQVVTFTATVVGQYGGGTATGTMTFQIGGKTVATVPVNGSKASFGKSFPARGVRYIVATYSGDSNNGGSTSPTFSEAISSTPYATTTTVATSGSPSLVGQSVTFTATVTFAGNVVPDGELVTFYDGSTEIGTGLTADGMATVTTSSLKAKTHTIKAIYAGDGTLKTSTGRVMQIVTN